MSAKTKSGIVYPTGTDTYPSAPWWKNLADSIETIVTGKAPTSHTHAEGDVTGLVADLSAKLPAANIARGSVTLPSVAAGGTVSGKAAFASAMPAAPAVVLCSTDQTRVQVAVAAPTTTGFNWAASNWTTAAVSSATLFYVAIL